MARFMDPLTESNIVLGLVLGLSFVRGGDGGEVIIVCTGDGILEVDFLASRRGDLVGAKGGVCTLSKIWFEGGITTVQRLEAINSRL